MRSLTRSLVFASVTPLALALPVLSRPLPHPHAVAPAVVETAVRGIDGAAAARVPGWGATLGPATARPVALTAPATAKTFQALGVTWANDKRTGDVEVYARVRQHGIWTEWHQLDGDGADAPDDTSAENDRGGTSPWFTGPADAYQVRVGARGPTPRDVRVSLVDPGRSAADSALGASTTLGSDNAEASIGRPGYIARAQWGADESLRTCCPHYSDTIKMGFVHHTDTSNSYSSSQAAAMVRSVYAFHTLSRGWSDIGYNFLVDKYGRIFEGRYGGVDRPVIGAHTGGFNTDTFGVSLLGTYTTVAPTSAELAALEKVFAWKLGLHYVNPYARTTLTSAGGSKYAAGVRVTFNNISGHRDAGLTSCPGNQTYNRLPTIRAAIKSYMGASLYYPRVTTADVLYLTTPSVVVRATTPATQSWRLTVRKAWGGTVVRTVTGSPTTSIAAVWNLHDSTGAWATPDTYALTLESWNSKTRARPYTVSVRVRSPLPDGLVSGDANGNPYAFVDGGALYSVSPALGRALRPSPAPQTYYASRSQLAAAQAGPRDGVFVKAPNGAQYVVVDGALRPVSSSVVTALGLSAPRSLPWPVLGVLPTGPAWTDTTRHPDGEIVRANDGTEWRIESGVRRPFTSLLSRNRWVKGWAIPAATSADLALPLGTPLAPPEGIVFRTANGDGYIVSGGTYRPLANALGYDIANAPLANDDDLAALPVGAPVTTAHPSGALLRTGTSTFVEVLGTTKRAVDASLLSADARPAVAPATGELASLGTAAWLAPSGLAGRAADGTVHVVESGRLVALAPNVATALGYATATLPALEATDFGPLPAGVLDTAAAHPAGTLVTDGTTTWLLDAGRRRAVAASLVQTWLGYVVLPATGADLALPTGAAAPPANGAVVATPDGAEWLVFRGVRRSLTAAVAHRLGLDAVVPQQVVSADLSNATTLGVAVL